MSFFLSEMQTDFLTIAWMLLIQPLPQSRHNPAFDFVWFCRLENSKFQIMKMASERWR